MLIAAVVVAISLFVIFVLGPAVLFLLHYLVFYVVVGVTILLRTLTGRPWIVELEEVDGYRIRAWRVQGWKKSRAVIDAVAEAIRRGEKPHPPEAEPADVVNA